jgi:hypothetical protein
VGEAAVLEDLQELEADGTGRTDDGEVGLGGKRQDLDSSRGAAGV